MNTRDEDVLFELLLHSGTLGATVIVFQSRIRELIKGLLRKSPPHLRLTLYILITTAVTAVLGKLFEEPLETIFKSSTAVCFMLAATGAILYLPRFFGKPRLEAHSLGWQSALLLGLAQALAIIPGISRSGTTISAGLLLGLNRKDAGEYSFLISIPIILGASLVKVPSLSQHSHHFTNGQMAAGVLASFLVGFLALKFLLFFVQKGKLHYFSWYCWAAAAAGLLFLR